MGAPGTLAAVEIRMYQGITPNANDPRAEAFDATWRVLASRFLSPLTHKSCAKDGGRAKRNADYLTRIDRVYRFDVAGVGGPNGTPII
jgi:hypothetical protein